MDTAQWPEGIGVVKSMEEKKQPRPQKPQAINCPRCNSTHTKFCYYNNYSLTQPRYFCKTCRRYWTEGGSLRNVPVGGGSRKNKRSSSSSPAASASKINKLIINPDHHHMGPPPNFSRDHQNPNKINIHDHQGQDLNLAYPQPNLSHEFTHDHQLPFNLEINKTYPSSTSTINSPQFSAMEFFKGTTGITSRGSSLMSSFISMPGSDSNSNTMIYSSAGIPFQEFKPSLNFSLDGFGSGYNGGSTLQAAGVQESATNNNNSSARLFNFPLDQELKPTTNEDVLDQQNRGEEYSNGYWNGGLGGGSW